MGIPDDVIEALIPLMSEVDDFRADVIVAMRKRLAAAEKLGWKLCPRVMTHEMVKGFNIAMTDECGGHLADWNWSLAPVHGYMAMWDAAPSVAPAAARGDG